ncbi:MAG: CHAT domain-containing protein [Caldilineaceae bacterium]|nr:CHAT domain-containing protein [Caldilineaceae bacterium]
MTIATLRDFELEIDAGDGTHYPVSVLRSPAGAARGQMTFPYSRAELEQWLGRVDAAVLAPGDADGRRQVQAFGATLFDALFQQDILTAYAQSRQAMAGREGGLRIRLRINAPELAAVPWEFLYDTQANEFVVLSRHTPVVRYLEILQADGEFTVTPPLRVLGIVANPADLPPLDVDKEKARLAAAIGRQDADTIELVWLESATWRSLHTAMQQGPWHIVHFVGHAMFDPQAGQGAILVEDEAGHAWPLPAEQLGQLLADHPSLRLAVLNACEGARGNEQMPFSSIAASLVRRGLPAVVAMQYAISDAAATEFAGSFYSALAAGLPVDSAVGEGRKAIQLANANSAEWGTPVLFTRLADGVIWTFPGEEQESGRQLRGLVRQLLVPLAAIVLILLLIAGVMLYPVLEPMWNPSQMEGRFNIAVAEFGEVAANGQVRSSEVGARLSTAVFDRLCAEYAGNFPQLTGSAADSVWIWHDGANGDDCQGNKVKNITFGPILGDSEKDRTRAAAQLAERIAADLVVYGLVRDGGKTLSLEFYYRSDFLHGEPDAAAGRHRIGEPIALPISFGQDPTRAMDQAVKQLDPRTQALFWLTVGMVKDFSGEQEEALRIFQQAERAMRGLDAPRGLDVIYYFIGREAFWLRQYDVAIDALEQAIALAPDYANAYQTLGATYFDRAQLFTLRAGVPPELEKCIAVEAVGRAAASEQEAERDLDRAVEQLMKAVELAPTSAWPPTGNVARLTLGMAYQLKGNFALLYGPAQDAVAWLDKGRAELEQVLGIFTEEDNQQYQAWAVQGLGANHLLRGLAIQATIKAEDSPTVVTEKAAASLPEFENAQTEFQRCIDTGQSVPDPVFQLKVIECGCTYYRDVTKTVQQQTETFIEARQDAQTSAQP